MAVRAFTATAIIHDFTKERQAAGYPTACPHSALLTSGHHTDYWPIKST
jgi:hypothetical protein